MCVPPGYREETDQRFNKVQYPFEVSSTLTFDATGTVNKESKIHARFAHCGVKRKKLQNGLSQTETNIWNQEHNAIYIVVSNLKYSWYNG